MVCFCGMDLRVKDFRGSFSEFLILRLALHWGHVKDERSMGCVLYLHLDAFGFGVTYKGIWYGEY